MKSESTLIIRYEPPLAWVVVNRPEARNALTTEMWRGMADRINELSSMSEIRVILLTGAGERAFIAGADIAELRTMIETRAGEVQAARFTRAAVEAIGKSPKPVVAMINGDCMGGGMLLAVACDLRLAATTARFAVPAVKLGVAYPPEEGVARLARLVGATAAAEILLTGRGFDAVEALRIGLLNRTHPREGLENAARAYAMEIAGCAPLAVTAHKRAIAHAFATPSAAESAELERLVDQCYRSEDCREGLAAFLEKKNPRFAGR